MNRKGREMSASILNRYNTRQQHYRFEGLGAEPVKGLQGRFHLNVKLTLKAIGT